MGVKSMKKIKINNLNEILYYDKLTNGLEVYMIPKLKLKNIYVTFNTKYGSVHNQFVPPGKKKMIKVPNGIAHFLEHKLFEQEDGVDPFVFYGNNGAEVNAFTSYFNTSYLFNGPNHFKENLTFLLDYVQKPYFTDENVNKEKGIIEQEIKMYDDMPYWNLDDGLRLNTFNNHPLRYSLAGSIKDIHQITKEALMMCYQTFYHPSNMFLIITGCFDPKEALEVIKENQVKKKFSRIKEIKIKKITEPNKVVKEYQVKKMNVEIPKLGFSIKIPINHLSLNKRARNLYVAILFDLLFDGTSSFNELMKEKEYLDSGITINILHTEEHILVVLYANTKYPTKLVNEIKKHLANFTIDNEDFNRKKKVYLSSRIYLFENIKAINHYLINDIITYGDFNNELINQVRKLKALTFQDLINNLDLTKQSVFVIKPL